MAVALIAPGVGAFDQSTPANAASVAVDVFPVAGPCFYVDTWGAARGGGRRHEGVDIIADEGTPLVAVVAGRISKMVRASRASRAGNYFRLEAPSGTYFTYIHLSRFAPGLFVGQQVAAGQLLGFVGRTGNASGPHLHFEAHPGGGAAVNPTAMVTAAGGCPRDSGDHKPAERVSPSMMANVFDPPTVLYRGSRRLRANIAFSIKVVGFPGIPDTRDAIELTVTLAADGPGRAAIWPCGEQAGLGNGTALAPLTAGSAASRLVIKPGRNGRVCLIADRRVTPHVAINAMT